jgi:hypothetical protein
LRKERWKDVVEASTRALDDVPAYEKALHRRAVANEKLDTWSSLGTSLEGAWSIFAEVELNAGADWKALDALATQNTLIKAQAKAAIGRIPARLDMRKKQETDEMLGKLKDLGNSFLGRFGLSTDSFVMTPNEGGGYGLSMKQ